MAILLAPNITRTESEVAPRNYYLSEAPGYRTIKFRDERYTLAMPWLHYHFEYFPQFQGKHYLWGVYMSARPLDISREVSFPCLPNFYRARPCWHDNGVGQSGKDPMAVLAELWDGTFNYDGELAWHPIWRYIAAQYGVKRRIRKQVLSAWEANVTTEDIINFPYWWRNNTLR